MFTLNIETTNDAFGSDDFGRKAETVRILRDVIGRIEDDDDMRGMVRDINGNTIGSWMLTDD